MSRKGRKIESAQAVFWDPNIVVPGIMAVFAFDRETATRIVKSSIEIQEKLYGLLNDSVKDHGDKGRAEVGIAHLVVLSTWTEAINRGSAPQRKAVFDLMDLAYESSARRVRERAGRSGKS